MIHQPPRLEIVHEPMSKTDDAGLIAAVYAGVKVHEWYYLDEDQRRAAMRETAIYRDGWAAAMAAKGGAK